MIKCSVLTFVTYHFKLISMFLTNGQKEQLKKMVISLQNQLFEEYGIIHMEDISLFLGKEINNIIEDVMED